MRHSERGEVTVTALGVLAFWFLAVIGVIAAHEREATREAIDRSRCEIEAASRLAPQMPREELAARQAACWRKFGIYLPWPK